MQELEAGSVTHSALSCRRIYLLKAFSKMAPCQIRFITDLFLIMSNKILHSKNCTITYRKDINHGSPHKSIRKQPAMSFTRAFMC